MTIFVDFGENHISLDVDGEDIASYSISKIDQLENGDICIECQTEGLNFDKGAYVEFMEVEGMTELNKDTQSKSSHDKQQYEVSHITKAENVNTFTIKKKEGIEYKKQTGAGVVVNAKRPKQFKFKSFEESLLKPIPEGEFALQVIDLSKFGHSENLHAGFLALLD